MKILEPDVIKRPHETLGLYACGAVDRKDGNRIARTAGENLFAGDDVKPAGVRQHGDTRENLREIKQPEYIA